LPERNQPAFVSKAVAQTATAFQLFNCATAPENNKSLPDLSAGQGQMGDGSSPVSLSRADIWRALCRAVSFPTPFSTASGVSGLVAGPSSALRPLDFE